MGSPYGPFDGEPQSGTPIVVALCEVLKALPIHLPEVRSATCRNPAGVNTTLANLRWVDPELEGGLSRGAKLDQVVWDLFAHDPERLRQVAEAIRQNGLQVEVAAVVDEPDEEAPEGQVLLRALGARAASRDGAAAHGAGDDAAGQAGVRGSGAYGLRSALRSSAVDETDALPFRHTAQRWQRDAEFGLLLLSGYSSGPPHRLLPPFSPIGLHVGTAAIVPATLADP